MQRLQEMQPSMLKNSNGSRTEGKAVSQTTTSSMSMRAQAGLIHIFSLRPVRLCERFCG